PARAFVSRSHSRQGSLECIQVDWLDQMRVESRSSRALPVLHLSIPAQRDHAQLREICFQATRDFIAVESRQADIEQHELRLERRDLLQCCFSRVCAQRLP